MNYLPLNIKYLKEKEGLSEEYFSALFGLGRGAMGSYIAEKANPKIETLQKISARYETTIDNLVNLDISKMLKSVDKNEDNEPPSEWTTMSEITSELEKLRLENKHLKELLKKEEAQTDTLREMIEGMKDGSIQFKPNKAI